MTAMKPHTRVNDILLGPLERPALRWLAAHMPAWMTPDILTAIGTVGALMTAVAFRLCHVSPAFLWMSTLGLVINWFGDSLDGTLARYRHIERPKYGFFIDHTVDAFNTTMVMFGLAISPYVKFQIGALTLVAYLMMMVLTYVRTYVDGVFKLSYGKLGPTEARAIIVLANTAIYFFGNPMVTTPWAQLSVYDIVVAAVGVLLLFFFVSSTLRQARVLARLGE